MSVTIRHPTERACLRCEREEIWQEDEGTWRAKATGRIYCVHEWNVTGTFSPIDV
ncbi:HEWD family protein [Halodesulfurarchaeum sp. HSR-GB]|uniref:HEWD family protein n=1 Tax=Halodesulfurarchaeum sp. HSR-GB TaxID=3074077 RepID=UPI00286795F4|nr:HEWD family protein [Halodesulfurarchaeum sp. HSR-GB]MDR5657520.1 HEWD family protein [Halodesulfurarchaeum sp. HSR-GB]